MKKSSLLFSFWTMLAAASSCAVSEVQEETVADVHYISSITAGQELSTKTIVSGNGTSVLWNTREEINVFQRGKSYKFVSTNQDTVAVAEFTCEDSLATGGASSDAVWAVYPYSAANVFDGTGVTVGLPSSQTALAGSFERGSFPAVARTTGSSMTFYNVGGGLRFSLSKSGIRAVSFSGNNGEHLAGRVKVTFDGDGTPVVTDTVQVCDSVVLTAQENEGFEAGKWYYISTFPATLSKGFTVKFLKVSGQTGTLSRDKATVIKRCGFGSISSIDKDVVFEDDPSSPRFFVDMTEPGVYTLTNGWAEPYCLCVTNLDQYVSGTLDSEVVFRIQSLITGRLVSFSLSSSGLNEGDEAEMKVKSVEHPLFIDGLETVKVVKKTSSALWLSCESSGYGYIFPL